MPDSSPKTDDSIKWVIFPDECGMLRRMIRSSGDKGFLLQFTGTGDGESVRRRALEFGFEKWGEVGSLSFMVDQDRAPFSAKKTG